MQSFISLNTASTDTNQRVTTLAVCFLYINETCALHIHHMSFFNSVASILKYLLFFKLCSCHFCCFQSGLCHFRPLNDTFWQWTVSRVHLKKENFRSIIILSFCFFCTHSIPLRTFQICPLTPPPFPGDPHRLFYSVSHKRWLMMPNDGIERTELREPNHLH